MSGPKVSEGSATAYALAWLEALIVNPPHDPHADASIWRLTDSAWREVLVGDAGQHDVAQLDNGPQLARYLVAWLREALPPEVQALSAGDAIGVTSYEVPAALDSVQCIFNDTDLEPGDHAVSVGTRVGFALVMRRMVREGAQYWTVAGVQHDWLVPAWMAELPNNQDLRS